MPHLVYEVTGQLAERLDLKLLMQQIHGDLAQHVNAD